ncbi:hypothetical protein NDU88_008665 [Pleurodeles waltl]|uniref:Uncharacterized protein n=1 Tax=Pleurodeles waltl TaxID=8319 RepID=A0AAV7PSQ3_PLEWA|nr:hypothetical protein NDU88_008665 [Pleurodeles waltl]
MCEARNKVNKVAKQLETLERKRRRAWNDKAAYAIRFPETECVSDTSKQIESHQQSRARFEPNGKLWLEVDDLKTIKGIKISHPKEACRNKALLAF